MQHARRQLCFECHLPNADARIAQHFLRHRRTIQLANWEPTAQSRPQIFPVDTLENIAAILPHNERMRKDASHPPRICGDPPSSLPGVELAQEVVATGCLEFRHRSTGRR